MPRTPRDAADKTISRRKTARKAADTGQAPKSPDATPSPDTNSWGFTASRQFVNWLAEHRLSLAVTTYQAGKLLLVGRTPDNRLSILQRNFSRSMGLWTDGQTLLLSSLYQILRFENTAPPGRSQNGFDRMFVPKMSYFTGDLDVHDIAVARGGRIVFVNTLFGCLATVSARWSFEPLWRPPFLSKLAAEDRCHLNGLAMEDGRPRYVTAVSEADVVDGWRDHRTGGGVLIDVTTNQILASGLSMPHSPRVHRGRVWLLNSGTGYFGFIDPASGTFEPLTFCPGYARGLAFYEDFALVGLSKPREQAFSGLPLQPALEAKKAQPRCGVIVIDLRTGDIVHSLYFDGAVSELYDVAVLPGVQRPGALGFETDEIRRAITVAPPPPSTVATPAPVAREPVSMLPAGAEMVAYIQRTGDVGARFGEWLGTPGSKKWIEGFGMSGRPDLTAEDIEYQAVLGRDWVSPWVNGKQFCGSRGMALPLLGFNLRLRGAAAEKFDCRYSAHFTDGTSVGPLEAGQPCAADSLAPLEAFRVELSPGGTAPAAVPEHNATTRPRTGKPTAAARKRGR